MAMNMVHKYTKTEVWPVVAGTTSGEPVVSAVGNQPGVALTSRGDATTSLVVGPYTISGIPSGGIGVGAAEATVAVDGAFRFPVTGVVASTPRNTLVYAVVSSGEVTSLTLTASTNAPFGKIDRFIGETSATEASVWIGDYVDAT